MTKRLKRWKESIGRTRKRRENRKAGIRWEDENKFTMKYHDKNIDDLFMPLEVDIIGE